MNKFSSIRKDWSLIETLIEEDRRILEILMDKLDQKLAFELGSEILNKKRNDIYKIKIKD